MREREKGVGRESERGEKKGSERRMESGWSMREREKEGRKKDVTVWNATCDGESFNEIRSSLFRATLQRT